MVISGPPVAGYSYRPEVLKSKSRKSPRGGDGALPWIAKALVVRHRYRCADDDRRHLGLGCATPKSRSGKAKFENASEESALR